MPCWSVCFIRCAQMFQMLKVIRRYIHIMHRCQNKNRNSIKTKLEQPKSFILKIAEFSFNHIYFLKAVFFMKAIQTKIFDIWCCTVSAGNGYTLENFVNAKTSATKEQIVQKQDISLLSVFPSEVTYLK